MNLTNFINKTSKFYPKNMQQSAKLQNLADFIKKKIENLQNLRIHRTSQKCTKKNTKKKRRSAEFADLRRTEPFQFFR